MSEQQPQAPDGYTSTRDYHGQNGVWAHESKADDNYAAITVISFRLLRPHMAVDDDGVWSFTETRPVINGHTVRLIPDSEHPEGGMTREHTVFDETTQKWTLPSIEDDIHAHHESQHDSDVALAHDNMCIADSMLTLVKVIEANLNGDQLAIARGKLGDFYDCIESLIDNSAIALITTAHIKSVGHITLPATPQGQHQKALDFATAFNTYLKSRTAGQLGGARYRYTLRLRTELIADAERVDSARFLPKEVSIGASGVTAASVFTKLKALLNPPS